MKTFSKYGLLVWVVAMMLLTGSCSRKKDTWARRTFHNITAHYNAYYNGNEALKEAVSTIAKEHKDNYEEVLDLFPLGTEESVKSVAPKLERAHEKASIAIHRHSMEFNGREKVKWVYHSYMLIGKAKFYGHEYGLAKQTFRYIAGKYSKENIKYDALLWLARVQVINGNYDEARGNLGNIQSKVAQGKVSRESIELFPLVYADLYLRQKNYDAAVPYLRQGIKLNRKKETRARLYFILGQVLQAQQKYSEAIAAYKQVLKNNASYAMDFNTRINMAKCFDGSAGNSKEIVNQLLKMLKDAKNKDFLDKIYYTLAEVELKESNLNKAVEYLELSVATSTNNNTQKALSALKLAEIYFTETKYARAQAYYDSTMLFLPKNYPNYESLKEKKDILTELVSYLLTVQREDSLQNLAALPEDQRNKFIDKLIQDEIEREKARQQAERERQESLQFLEEKRMTQRSVTQAGAAKFYFYNPQTLSYGFTEFRKKWGERKLGDYWRISNKQQLAGNDLEALSEEEKSRNDSIKKLESNKKSRTYYLKDIPLTEAMKDSSDARIAEALYNMGFIYKEKLQDYPKAKDAFEDLLKRYPKTKYTPAAYYFLYQLYDRESESSDARFYKKALIKEYPQTDYAKILQDPNYYKKLLAKQQEAKKIYRKAYRMYELHSYNKSINYADEVLSKYPDDVQTCAKSQLLKALAIGKTRDTTQFIEALKLVTNQYPQTQSDTLAADILQRLRQGQKSVQAEEEKPAPKEKEKASIYTYDENTTHMFIVVINKKNMKAAEFQNRLSNHNDTYFASDHLNVSAIPITSDIIVVGVSNFNNKKKALIYYKTLKRNPVTFSMLKRTNGHFYLISQINYTRLYKSRDLDAYRAFHKKYYPEVK